MEDSVQVEISVKLEPEDQEITDDQEFNELKAEVWIKPEWNEDDSQTSHNYVQQDNPNHEGSFDNHEGSVVNHEGSVDDHEGSVDNHEGSVGKGSLDEKPKSQLPFKKRIEIKLEDGTKFITPKEECQQSSSTEKPPENNQSNSEIPLMYSYEITKNVQIVTIDEEERQIEHKETLSTRQHMRHVCEYCALGFVVEQAFLMHMKVHMPESGSHECDICHSFLKTPDILYRHRLRHFRRYRCLICGGRFKDRDSAACHVMTDHEHQAFTCQHCGKGFKRPQYLKRHVEQHHTKPHQLQCPVCQKVFHERGWYRTHVRTHNEEVKTKTVKVTLICDVCSRTFHTKANLIRHLAKHEDNTICKTCFAKFNNRNELSLHYLNVHQEVYKGALEVTCPQCLRVCATRAILRLHMRRMHTDRTKKFQCDHCLRLYLTKGEVRAHIVWSHGARAVRGHACPCGRRFRTPALLRDHTLRFHGDSPPPRNHACELCGKAFGNKQVLNRHKKSHSDEMYPCNECGVFFKSQPYVKIHYQIKHMNMTRAQIKEQRRKNRLLTMQSDALGKTSIWEPSIPTKIKVVQNDILDPLEVREGDVQDNIENELQAPLFQTFINAQE